METSTVAPIPVTNSTDRARDSLKRRKRKKMQKQSDGKGTDQNNRNLLKNDLQITQWRSEAQQQVYGSKLWLALRQGSGTGAASNKALRLRAVRETADRVLAVTAKGRTRWSRAILTNKLKLKFMMSNRKQRGLVATATGNIRLKKRRGPVLRLKRKSLPAVQKQARVLGGLVPGCRKQRLPVVLKEATSYIPALEMQVKAMAALFELLSGGSSSTSVTGAGYLRPPPCL
ncbi:hypothetical protein L1987_05014 [Smallanthus sonchifolius]|uniref:Uncharacterized protein n=1 Tax=Smallanthus sonchifolius TaxID=185202 RepID=A0ACB9JU62_9ASTR|nr:hypothetical protein L1987_05014 [Smallanthus sonchifolius]